MNNEGRPLFFRLIEEAEAKIQQAAGELTACDLRVYKPDRVMSLLQTAQAALSYAAKVAAGRVV